MTYLHGPSWDVFKDDMRKTFVLELQRENLVEMWADLEQVGSV